MHLLSIDARHSMHLLLTALLIATCVATSGLVRAQSAAEPDAAASVQAPLVIGTRQVPPFAMRNAEGSWSGITIDLWAQIAEQLSLDYRLVELELSRMIDDLAKGEVDAVAAALTITSARERRVDFTQPFYTSGLGIAVAQHPEGGFIATIQRLFSGRFLHSVAALLGLLTLIGMLIWLAERRRNAQFHGGLARGVGSGLWWSAVTMTTVGYGDKAPITAIGRGIALVWMFASVIIVSGFTAAIATALTVGELRHPIRGPNDLYGTRVITVAGSTSAEFLTRFRVRHKTVPALEQALNQLAAGDADAVLYDAPILRFLIARHHAKSLRVLPQVLQRQDYGIALPQPSPLRESINRALLEITRGEKWEAELERYIGTNQ
ncbi:MAG: transporter substrate-binding domain-containing protein [Thiohalocapsa sp.]